MSSPSCRFPSLSLWRAVFVALAAVASPSLNARAQSAPHAERSGQFADGQPWQITVPAGWNGIVINDLDRIGNDRRAAYLLARRYAYTGTRRHPDRQSKWDPQAESDNMVKVMERFTADFGRPRFAIQFGCSGGGSVALSVAEDHADVFQGAIALHASMPGTVSNMRLDLTFALKALLDTANVLPLLVDGASAEAGARSWATALERAAMTPHGRARMALAGTLAQYPAWGSASAAPTAPRSSSERALEDALLRVVVDGTQRAIATRPRYDGPAGPMSSNVGVDYTDFYRRADSAQRRTVERMYEAAGLSVNADLARINAAPRLASTPEADAYWRSRAHKGTIGIPVLQASNIGDAMTPAAGMVAYQAMVKRNGREHLYRQAFIDAPGHCTFNNAELGALVETMVRRLEGEAWDDLTSPARLNTLGRDVEGTAPRFTVYGAGWSLPTRINRAPEP